MLTNLVKNYQYNTDDNLSVVTVECSSSDNDKYSLIGTYIYDKGLIAKINFVGTYDFNSDYYKKMQVEFEGLLDKYIQDKYRQSYEESFFY
ncbi:MAG: hypothetical protein IJ289_08155 [Clostridia bacterium]|nr:hypothetical protein [Clostridia bacterium]